MHTELQKLHNCLQAAAVRYDHARGEVIAAEFDHAKRVFDGSNLFGVANSFGSRNDANETAVLARQLLYVKTQEANVQYPDLKVRNFIPVSNEVPSGAEQYSIKTWDKVGSTRYGSNYADDMPRADVSVTETIASIKPIINAYGYNVQELRNSAMMGGISLDARRADVARDVHARAQETIGAVGDAVAGFKGLANATGVPVIAGLTGLWNTTATDAQILADVNALIFATVINTNGLQPANTLLLGTKAFQYINSKPAGANWTFTIAQWILKNNPYLKTIDTWVQLDLAGAGGTIPRAIAYRKDPIVVQLEIPQEFEQFPVQQKGLEFIIPCHSRMGGVSLRYPKSAAYGDSLTT